MSRESANDEVSIPEGRLVDFLTGRLVPDTPEEYVRQNIEKALVRQYKYDPQWCEAEFRIGVGSSYKRVDIALFPSGVPHLQENAKILVETKRAGTNPLDRKEGIGQLQSYMAACLNAEYGLWTNGDDRYCFAKRRTAGGYSFEELIDIPAAGQTEAEAQRPKRKDLMPAAADNLLFAFRRCHNYIAATEGMHKTDAFWELLKLIFCKIEDERSRVIDFYVTATERASATAAATCKARIQRLFADKVVRKYPEIFQSRESKSVELKAIVVAYVVSQLQRFSLLGSSVDVKGKAYEEIVGSNLRGDRGEFFTPRNACRMAVHMMAPGPAEKLLDPACGTGGFLITAMNVALERLEASERAEWTDPKHGTEREFQELYRQRGEYLLQRVAGIDLNPALVRAAKMNMVMNNDGEGGLFQADSLAHPHTWDAALQAKVALGTIDVVFTNPPFGANIMIDDERILTQYDLAARWDKDEGSGAWTMRRDHGGRAILQSSQPPEILFIERCLQLVKEGSGRVGMVIPNGILNNPALGYVRQWLLSHAQILAVVDMARELFQPNNDTQTSMLLMRRLSSEEQKLAAKGRLPEYDVFMAVTEKVGQDKRGNSIYRRTDSGEELLVVRKDVVLVTDPQTRVEREREVEVKERVVDDDLPDVAEAYLASLRP